MMQQRDGLEPGEDREWDSGWPDAEVHNQGGSMIAHWL